MGKKRPGLEAELISLHSFTFEEVVDTLPTTKPMKHTTASMTSTKPIKKTRKNRKQEQRKQAAA